MFTIDPVLRIFKRELETRVETDILDYALEARLLQKHGKLNYNIYNKELLGIVIALKE